MQRLLIFFLLGGARGNLFISGQMFVYYEFTSLDFGRYNTNDT